MATSALAEIDVLQAALGTSISALKASIDSQGFSQFKSDDISPHPLDTGLPDPTTFYARRAIVGLCQQIIALVQDPAQRALIDHYNFLLPACIVAATETKPSFAEVMLEAPSGGITLDDVAKKTGIDRIKLRSFARMLATAGYVKEVSVDCFIPTRSTRGLAPGAGPVAEMNGIFSTYAPPATIVPKVLNLPSDSTTPAPFEVFFKTPFFPFLQENPAVLKRFHQGMTEIENHLDKGISADVHLDDLGSSITLVDVGAGHGGMSMQFLKHHPGWKAILQDRAEVIPQARQATQFWKDNMPDALETDRVSFLAHSFLEPTPLPPAPEGSPYVFLIKSVLHNWPDDMVKLMLENLVPAAPPGTKLLIINFTPSTPDSPHELHVDEFFDRINGKTMEEVQRMDLPVPLPLDVGFGAGEQYVSELDILMLLLFNSRARTAEDFRELLESTSWKLESRTRLRGASSLLRACRV
ncbi:S-adenosyl-L-methionine-dependent methyltransferase [Dacryopinax primogenitus]|uniref:S-adenosyl-L-methionine-dependent methyltransferase n=1 Tax=Dacryopinax primogenitus (strain DJM 731) TaxID=1858805 RepID=M5G8C1_DACPD|nr:S-adenosyl-L-methionine-dependent methyltransferase [Dacryopinax primogenitus]EJU00008.1 S-adenosyl-L-methionine-dependent methyltransferase [Dacryopinax primogenitus]